MNRRKQIFYGRPHIVIVNIFTFVGLIIGVVAGTFLILSLVFILCCACQGKTVKRKKRYALVERDSNNSLSGARKNMSNASTNTLEGPCRSATTEESSLEMSDARSYSTKQSDDMNIVGYPPPPSLYDTPNDVYYLLPVNQHQTKTNPVYNIQQRPARDSVAEELPLPPPPHSIVTIPECDGEEDLGPNGLNPTFKTFLDKTIAVKPMNIQDHRHTPHSPPIKPELRGLITSDL